MILAIALLLAATTAPDPGPYPTHYDDDVRTWAQGALRDPDSAKFGRFSLPRREWLVEDRKRVDGWSACVSINAKNAYGGYTGAEVWWFFFRDGRLVRAQNTSQWIAGVVPGTTISINHEVNCSDGEGP